MFKALSDDVLVATGPFRPGDVAAAQAAGVVAVVNNRPDGEETGQPTSGEIEAAVRAAGLNYHHIPVAGGIVPGQVAAMAAAMDAAMERGMMLAFCRSGTRSAFLWALAAHARGMDGETILARAGAAGYDLSALRPHLD